jgi:uncharacterized protein (TIGR02145 family)
MKNILPLIALPLLFSACNLGNDVVSATGIALDKNFDTISVGQSTTLTATVSPENATYQTVEWINRTPAVASVNYGLVTGLMPGSTVVAVSLNDGEFADSCEVTVVSACNYNTPGWGSSLGTVSFVSPAQWTIVRDSITQIWSDAVQATGCNKTTFAGGLNGNYIADCRSNSGYSGDLFSWCAVARFGDVLCPGNWRVPTKEDFVNLDIALGGSGLNRGVGATDAVLLKYLASSGSVNQFWNGAFNGMCSTDGTLTNQGVSAYYWSSEEILGTVAYYLFFSNNNSLGNIYPQQTLTKTVGLSVRCIQD